jgi:hypothetical protein
LVYPDFPSDCFPVWTNGSYAWVKADPWEEDGSNWGEPYLSWYYPTLDFEVTNVPTLTYGIGAVWAGFDDAGVGREWSCEDHRWIDRKGSQVYESTWDILEEYNESVGISYSVPISWVQLSTLNDYMEGTALLASVEVTGVDGVDSGYGYGHQYIQQTENHAREFKELPNDDELDIYVAQHIYNARLVSGTISNTVLIENALSAFHSGYYTEAMALADEAAGIPAPTNVTAIPTCTDVRVCWEDRLGASLATGHRVYYGLASGEYISSTVVPTDTCVTLTDLEDRATYYLSVTTLGLTNSCETWYTSESWYSDEVIVRTCCVFLPVVLKSY